MSALNPIDHLPECDHDQACICRVPYCDLCDCERLRACEDRIRQEYTDGITQGIRRERARVIAEFEAAQDVLGGSDMSIEDINLIINGGTVPDPQYHEMDGHNRCVRCGQGAYDYMTPRCRNHPGESPVRELAIRVREVEILDRLNADGALLSDSSAMPTFHDPGGVTR